MPNQSKLINPQIIRNKNTQLLSNFCTSLHAEETPALDGNASPGARCRWGVRSFGPVITGEIRGHINGIHIELVCK